MAHSYSHREVDTKLYSRIPEKTLDERVERKVDCEERAVVISDGGRGQVIGLVEDRLELLAGLAADVEECMALVVAAMARVEREVNPSDLFVNRNVELSCETEEDRGCCACCFQDGETGVSSKLGSWRIDGLRLGVVEVSMVTER